MKFPVMRVFFLELVPGHWLRLVVFKGFNQAQNDFFDTFLVKPFTNPNNKP